MEQDKNGRLGSVPKPDSYYDNYIGGVEEERVCSYA
jgi:hypothetical protein